MVVLMGVQLAGLKVLKMVLTLVVIMVVLMVETLGNQTVALMVE